MKVAGIKKIPVGLVKYNKLIPKRIKQIFLNDNLESVKRKYV